MRACGEFARLPRVDRRELVPVRRRAWGEHAALHLPVRAWSDAGVSEAEGIPAGLALHSIHELGDVRLLVRMAEELEGLVNYLLDPLKLGGSQRQLVHLAVGLNSSLGCGVDQIVVESWHETAVPMHDAL